MVIQSDEEGLKVLEQLCDIALKVGGMSNLKAVNDFWAIVKPIEKKEE